jgi:putative aldouronate transport system substrate-binding protein
MRWVDALYEPRMSAQVSYGPVGETLVENADGILEQAQLPEGVNAGELRQKVALGGGAPHVITRSDFESVILPEPRALQRAQALEENYLPYIEPDFYPSVFFDVEELEQIGQIEPDIDALVEQKRAEWIVSGGIEDEWTGYVDQLRNMGLDDLLKIYQAGYDRYQAAAG